MKAYSHRGIRIVKTPFGKWQTPGLTWGSEPGEFHTFPTLTSAKEFIDRRHAEKEGTYTPKNHLFWAETYRGSGRLTGKTMPTEPFQNLGWVPYDSEEQFYRDFMQGQHDECHTPSHTDHNCPHCREAGWPA